MGMDETAKPVSGFRGPKVVGGIITILGVLTLGAIVAPTLAMRDRPPELEVYGDVPAFEFKDHTGGTINNEHLVGRVVIMNFVFTRCASVCPVFTMRMRRVQDRTSDIPNDLKLLSFTVDPEHDTPEVLARYAEKHGVDDRRWRFVTGDHETVKKVVSEGFALAMDVIGEQPMGGPDIVHSEHFVLVDRKGQIRGYYNSTDANRVERMLRDMRRLLREL